MSIMEEAARQEARVADRLADYTAAVQMLTYGMKEQQAGIVAATFMQAAIGGFAVQCTDAEWRAAMDNAAHVAALV
jgi:hypothetical protein